MQPGIGTQLDGERPYTMSKAESRVNIKLWRLEAVRGLAALYVAIGHAVGHTAKIAVFSDSGKKQS